MGKAVALSSSVASTLSCQQSLSGLEHAHGAPSRQPTINTQFSCHSTFSP